MCGIFKRWAAIAFVASTIATGTGAAHARSHDPAAADHGSSQIDSTLSALDENLLAVRIANSLSVNTDPTFYLVVPNKCEAAGEYELHLLSVTSKVEESFVFIPARCLWIEIGVNETRRTVKPDKALIDQLVSFFKVVTVYHLHVGQPPTIESYFPAYIDLLSVVLINLPFRDRPEVTIRHKVITAIGTIEYAFSPDAVLQGLETKLDITGLKKYLAQNLAYELRRRSRQSDYFQAVAACRTKTGGLSENIARCFPIYTGAFHFEFTPPETSDVANFIQ